MAGDLFQYFLNVETGELDFLPIDFDNLDEDEKELLEEIDNSNRYLGLPGQFEINEYEIMKNFAYSLEDEATSNELLAVLQRRKPFRNFKDRIIYCGVREQYFEFREKAFYEIAKSWCEVNNIEYE